jgi:monoamine oxidase
MLAFLRRYGDLTPDLKFRGSSRSGYRTLPGAASDLEARRDPVPLSVLLDEDMWGAMLFEESFDFQATIFSRWAAWTGSPMHSPNGSAISSTSRAR